MEGTFTKTRNVTVVNKIRFINKNLGYYNEKVFFVKFKAKFDGNKTVEFLNDLINRLDQFGLFQNENSSNQQKYTLGDDKKNEKTLDRHSSVNKRKRLNHWSIFSISLGRVIWGCFFVI